MNNFVNDNIALLGAYSITKNVEELLSELEGYYCRIAEDTVNKFNLQIANIGYIVWYVLNGDRQSEGNITHVALIDQCSYNNFSDTCESNEMDFHITKMVRLRKGQQFPYIHNCRKFDNDQLVQAAVGTVYIKEIDMRFFDVLHQVLPFETYIIGEEFYR